MKEGFAARKQMKNERSQPTEQVGFSSIIHTLVEMKRELPFIVVSINRIFEYTPLYIYTGTSMRKLREELELLKDTNKQGYNKTIENVKIGNSRQGGVCCVLAVSYVSGRFDRFKRKLDSVSTSNTQRPAH